MAWFKVDDKLWGHPKWLAVPMRSRGLWVSAGSWCAANETDGKVPRHVLRTLGGSPADAKALVNAGLWREARAGWIFHEWNVYQPDAASLKAGRQAASTGGEWGNHQRWHVKRGVNVDTCSYCQGTPPLDEEPPLEEGEIPSGTRYAPDRVPESGGESSRPEPEPDRSKVSRGGSVSSDPASTPQICGRSHSPTESCGACGIARRKAKTDDAQAERDANKRTRDADARARAERQAEADATEPAPRELIEAAKARAKAARSLDSSKEEQA